MNLNGKIALITGASKGIGKETALLFKEYGARVIGTFKEDPKENDSEIEYMKLDVTDAENAKEVVKRIYQKYGKLDILVNNAGITEDAMTKRMTEQQFDSVIDVNLKGTWNMTRLLGPLMQEQKSGSIINLSSVVGIYGNIGQANYAASKAGIIGMTLSWAKEFSRKNGNVRVNAVAPGYTMTDMLKTVPEELLEKFAETTMLGRLAMPIEVANVILFLASDLSSYVTGTVIHVNGGMRL